MKTTCSLLLLAAVATLGGLAITGCTSSGHDHSSHSHAGHAHGGQSVKLYPLKSCLVTDEAFEHGQPYIFVHEGQQIKLCCKDCLADFKKEPAKYLSKLNAPK